MKAVYTYWNNNGNKPYMNFSSKETFIEMATESIRLANNIFDSVTIYTDDIGYSFINGLFDNVNIEIIDFGKFRTSFWNYPKLVTYSIQTEPFVHLDFDFLLKEISDDILEADIISEKIRGRLIPHKDALFLNDEIWLSTNQIICSGCLGGNNLDVFKELKYHADKYVNNYDLIVNFNTLVAIEEVYLTYLSIKYNLKVKTLNTKYYTHHQSIHYK